MKSEGGGESYAGAPSLVHLIFGETGIADGLNEKAIPGRLRMTYTSRTHGASKQPPGLGPGVRRVVPAIGGF